MALVRTLIRRLQGERGMTLVELLTVMALLGIVMTSVIVLYLSGLRAQTDMTSKFNSETMLHVGLDRIRYDLHLACGETAQSATSVTISIPGGTPALCTTPASVTWCTHGSGSDYGLYRIDGSACSGGQKFADYLTGGSIFSYQAPDSPQYSWALARLHVDITVNGDPAKADLAYHVQDDIAFGNSARCVAGTTCP